MIDIFSACGEGGVGTGLAAATDTGVPSRRNPLVATGVTSNMMNFPKSVIATV